MTTYSYYDWMDFFDERVAIMANGVDNPDMTKITQAAWDDTAKTHGPCPAAHRRNI